MAALSSDLRLALRLLFRRPGFAALAILTLGLGIGASTAVFSMVRGVLFRPLPFPEPEMLVSISETRGEARDILPVSLPTLNDWKDGQRSFSGLAGWMPGHLVMTGREGDPRRVQSAVVSRDFFSVLGAPLRLGRAPDAGEHQEEGPRVVVLSHDFWERELGEDPGVLGQSLTLDGADYRVVGVVGPDFRIPETAELWVPLERVMPEAREIRGAHLLRGVGRMAPGVTPEGAQEELAAISSRIPDYADPAYGARVRTLHEEVAGTARPALLTLLGAVILVLLVACVNVANLILARTVGRRGEMAVRTALGAGPTRIRSLVVAESLVLSVLAGMVGVLIAVWGLDLLLLMAPEELPRTREIRVDGAVLLFGLGASLVAGLVAGLLPTIRMRPEDVAPALTGTGGGVARPGGGRTLSRLLVVAEVAVSVLLLAGAALLGRSFLTITAVDPGFRPEGILTFSLSLPGYRYQDEASWTAFWDELLERMNAVPGVTSVALTRNPPLSGTNQSSPVRIEGRTLSDEEASAYVQFSTVTPGYFSTVGTPVLEGRGFQEEDGADAPPVAVVNQAFVRRFLAGDPPLDVRARTLFGQPLMRRIVGVVGDVRHASLTEVAPPTFYVPMAQQPPRGQTVMVATTGEPTAMVPMVREVVRSLDPGLPLVGLTTLEEMVSRSMAEPRFHLQTLAIFAFLALLVAGVGFYGVMAGSVARRRRELGIRLAVGAPRKGVLGMVLLEAGGMVVLGLVLGMAGALALGHTLQGLLYQVHPADPAALASGASVALLAGILAAWLPARRAAAVDPMEVLRS